MNKYMSALVATAGIISASNVSADDFQTVVNIKSDTSATYLSAPTVDNYPSTIGDLVILNNFRTNDPRIEKTEDVAENSSIANEAAKTL